MKKIRSSVQCLGGQELASRLSNFDTFFTVSLIWWQNAFFCSKKYLSVEELVLSDIVAAFPIPDSLRLLGGKLSV